MIVPPPVRVTVSTKALRVKVAVTVFAASIVTLQAPVPEHAPDQPPKAEFASGAAPSATTVSPVIDAEQVAPHAIVAGVLVTVPPPVPVLLTASVNDAFVNVAVTLRAALIVVVHAPVPAQSPLQPANVLVDSGVAVSVTTAPTAKLEPVGLVVTVPLPFLLMLILNVVVVLTFRLMDTVA